MHLYCQFLIDRSMVGITTLAAQMSGEVTYLTDVYVVTLLLL